MVAQELLGLFVGGLGAVMLYNAVKMGRASARRDEFEPVTARVREADLETDSNRTGGTTTTYVPTITYEYTVDGETYVNDNLYPGPATAGSNSEDEQRSLLDEYPEGETVQAYYDPTDPADSFLEDESRTRQATGLGVLGGLLLAFGVVTVVLTPF